MAYICIQIIKLMSQSLTNILVHCVFHKSQIAPVIKPEDRQIVNRFVRETCQNLGCPCLIANGPGDHLHLLLALSPTVALSDLVKEVKRLTTRLLKDKDSQLYCNFSWQSGYGAFSVSSKFKDAIYNYIVHQEEHHHNQSSKDEFLLLLRNAQITKYDDDLYWNNNR